MTDRRARDSGGISSYSSGDPTLVGTRSSSSGQSLADVLERVLDKGIVIAGDIRVNLLDIELLTIRIRLIVASVDKAREMGINWWEGDPFISSPQDGDQGELQSRVDALEKRLDEVAPERQAVDGGGGQARA
jgi:hypothetical protein